MASQHPRDQEGSGGRISSTFSAKPPAQGALGVRKEDHGARRPPHHHPITVLTCHFHLQQLPLAGTSSPQSFWLQKSAHLSISPRSFFSRSLGLFYCLGLSSSWQENCSASRCSYVPARSSKPCWPFPLKDIFVLRIQCWRPFLPGHYSLSPGIHYFREQVGSKSFRYCWRQYFCFSFSGLKMFWALVV